MYIIRIKHNKKGSFAKPYIKEYKSNFVPRKGDDIMVDNGCYGVVNVLHIVEKKIFIVSVED